MSLPVISFGTRAAQFGFVSAEVGIERVLAGPGDLEQFVHGIRFVLLLAASLTAIVICLWLAIRRSEGRAWYVASACGLTAGGVLGLVGFSDVLDNQSIQATQIVTLVLVRPIALGFALCRQETARLTLSVALAVASSWLVRLILAATSGEPIWRLDAW